MMRTGIAALLLAASTPALAGEPEEQAAEERLQARRATLEEKIADRRKERERLVEERDAARVKANTYVLPQYKLEAQKKQDEIDAADAEIAALEKELAGLEK